MHSDILFVASLIVSSSHETFVEEIAGFGEGLSWNQSVVVHDCLSSCALGHGIFHPVRAVFFFFPNQFFGRDMSFKLPN